MKSKVYYLCAILLLFCQPLYAQQQPNDPFAEFLFPPEIVMKHQRVLGLNDAQKEFFKSETRNMLTRFTELQWQLQDEMEKLVSLVKQGTVDEQSVLAQLDKVLSIEQEIKRAHFSLVIRIR